MTDKTIIENEVEQVDYIADAIEAMLGGNRIKFGDAINAMMHAKATEVVNARRENLAQTMFNASEDIEGDLEGDTEETEEAPDADLEEEFPESDGTQ